MTIAMSGLVLAGGSSRRMGRDKAQIPYRGELLVLRAVRRLSQVVEEVIVASGDGCRLDHLGLHQVPDLLSGAGPLAGIAAGLAAARHPLVCVLAVDMPDASPSLFARLAGLWDGEAAVVPFVEGHPEPLHAVWSRAAAPAVATFLGHGGRAVHQALKTIDTRLVGPEHWRDLDARASFARNLNFPEDVAALGA